jgi:hypothetical protein
MITTLIEEEGKYGSYVDEWSETSIAPKQQTESSQKFETTQNRSYKSSSHHHRLLNSSSTEQLLHAGATRQQTT